MAQWIIKWYNLMHEKGVKLSKVYFVNSSSSSALTGVTVNNLQKRLC